mgnify:FL=1
MALAFGNQSPSENRAKWDKWVDALDANGTLEANGYTKASFTQEMMPRVAQLTDNTVSAMSADDSSVGFWTGNMIWYANSEKLGATLRDAGTLDKKFPGILDWLESAYRSRQGKTLWNSIVDEYNKVGYRNRSGWKRWVISQTGGSWVNMDGELTSRYQRQQKDPAWQEENKERIKEIQEADEKAAEDKELAKEREEHARKVALGEELDPEVAKKIAADKAIKKHERVLRDEDLLNTPMEIPRMEPDPAERRKMEDRNFRRRQLLEEKAKKQRDIDFHGEELDDDERNRIEGRARRKAVLEEELRLKVAERQRFRQDLDNVGQGFHDEQEIRKLAAMLVNEERDARGEKTVPLRDDGNVGDGETIEDIEKFEAEVSNYLNDNVGLRRPIGDPADNNPFRKFPPPSKGEGIWTEGDKSLASDIQDAREKSTKESLDGTRDELAKNLRDAQIAGKESEVIKAREALSNYDSEMLKGKHALYVPEDPLGERDRITAGMKGVRESLANAQLALRKAEEDGDEEQIDFQKTQIAQYEGELKKAEKELENLKPASVRDRLVDTLMRKGKSHVQGATADREGRVHMGMSREEAEREADILYQRAVEDEKAEAAA